MVGRGATITARPNTWLGAPATGGLALPAAMPTADQLYAPRAVWIEASTVIVADTGNHRVLIWHDVPAMGRDGSALSHSAADVVLGQPDFSTEGAQAGGRGPAQGMRLPTGVLVHEGRLVVADAWNHRLLVWNDVPRRSDTPPDVIVGQPDSTSVAENRGGDCGPTGFYWPFGLAMADRFYVADTGNRRVLAWPNVPEPDEPPCLIMGQDSFSEREENRGKISANSFRWPHDIAVSSGENPVLYVADAGNHRVLGWQPFPAADCDATIIHGQGDFESGSEFPYGPQSASALRFPYAISIAAHPGGGSEMMAVADTANNRVLVWDQVPTSSRTAADYVLGQPNFEANGENRWDSVLDDTLCWPYGICLHDGRLAVADSGNNRVMIWGLGE